MEHRRPAPSGASHLDLLALDAVRAGEGTATERAHIAACPACRASLADLEGFAAALSRRRAPALEVPPEVDGAVLAAASRALETVRRRRPSTWRPLARIPVPLRIAAVALMALGLGIWLAMLHRPGGTTIPVASRPVDIVDAYTLALEIRSGRPVGPEWDADGDGMMDLRDVEAIARRSVALGGDRR